MMLGTPGTEEQRMRVGFSFLIIGLLLVFWAWGSWIYRTSVPVQAQAMARSQTSDGSLDQESEQGAAGDRVRVARAFWLFLLVGGALVLLVIFGSYVIVRAMRRYRSVLEAQDQESTNKPDVWSMHKVPPDYDDDDDGSQEPEEYTVR